MFVTIAGAGEVSGAEVLAASAVQHCPETPFRIFAVGGAEMGQRTLARDPQLTWWIEQVFSGDDLRAALMPHALLAAIESGADRAVYLAPSAYLRASPRDLLESDTLAFRAVPAAPVADHLLSDVALSVGAGAIDLIRDWTERVDEAALSDQGNPRLLLDSILVTSEVELVRDWRYRACVDWLPSEPPDSATLIDFRGFDAAKPWFSGSPRVRLSERPDWAEVFAEYAHALETGGDSATVTPRDPLVGKALRWAAASETLDRKQVTDDQSLLLWARTPVGPGSPVTRYLEALWHQRHDLAPLIPNPLGEHGQALFEWARDNGVAEGQVPEAWMPSHTQAPSLVVMPRPGVNIFGYVGSELGMGEVARCLIRGADAVGLPHVDIASTRTSSRTAKSWPRVDERFGINLVAINADQFELWRTDVGPEDLRDRYTVGVWAWELDRFPESMHHALDWVDEVWAISSFVRDAIAACTTKPVHVLPLNVPVRPGRQPIAPPLGADGCPYFLTMFDHLSDVQRKNPWDVVRAFTLAFPKTGEARLVIKSINSSRDVESSERLRYVCAAREDVVLIEDYVSAETRDSLVAGCIAYVSLHRSEGFGLGMAEAMALGRPTIATAYSGNLDFMNKRNSLLVPYELVDVTDSRAYHYDAQWANPDIEAAAQAMLAVVNDPQMSRRLGETAARDIAAGWSATQTGTFVRKRVRAITGLRRLRRWSDPRNR